MKVPSVGPAPKPSGLLAAKMPIARPSLRRGVTSRMAAIITPVLPSWNPTRSIAATSCQSDWLAATTPNTAASTRALRMITALRLYLSAQTPHSGMNGSPERKNSAPRMPTKCCDIACREADLLEPVGQERVDLRDAQPFHERRDPVDGQQSAPVGLVEHLHHGSLTEEARRLGRPRGTGTADTPARSGDVQVAMAHRISHPEAPSGPPSARQICLANGRQPGTAA